MAVSLTTLMAVKLVTSLRNIFCSLRQNYCFICVGRPCQKWSDKPMINWLCNDWIFTRATPRHTKQSIHAIRASPTDGQGTSFSELLEFKLQLVVFLFQLSHLSLYHLKLLFLLLSGSLASIVVSFPPSSIFLFFRHIELRGIFTLGKFFSVATIRGYGRWWSQRWHCLEFLEFVVVGHFYVGRRHTVPCGRRLRRKLVEILQ